MIRKTRTEPTAVRARSRVPRSQNGKSGRKPAPTRRPPRARHRRKSARAPRARRVTSVPQEIDENRVPGGLEGEASRPTAAHGGAPAPAGRSTQSHDDCRFTNTIPPQRPRRSQTPAARAGSRTHCAETRVAPGNAVSRRTPDRTGGAPPPAPGPDRRATRGQPVTTSHGASRGPSPGPLALGSARLGTVRLAANRQPRRSENRIDIESSRSYNTYLIRQVNIFHLKVPTSVLLLEFGRAAIADSSAHRPRSGLG